MKRESERGASSLQPAIDCRDQRPGLTFSRAGIWVERWERRARPVNQLQAFRTLIDSFDMYRYYRRYFMYRRLPSSLHVPLSTSVTATIVSPRTISTASDQLVAIREPDGRTGDITRD